VLKYQLIVLCSLCVTICICAGSQSPQTIQALSAFTCPLCITVKTPRITLLRDAHPSRPLGRRCELWPVLHFAECAAAAFAKIITLAGRANGNTRCVGRSVVPCQPSSIGLAWHRPLICRILLVIHQQRIHLRQRTQLRCQSHSIRRRRPGTPIVDGRLDIGDVDTHTGGGLRQSSRHGERMIPRPDARKRADA
jgi:hypothetical protein